MLDRSYRVIHLNIGNPDCTWLVITKSFLGDRLVIFGTLIACVGITVVKRSHSPGLANALADTGRENQNHREIN